MASLPKSKAVETRTADALAMCRAYRAALVVANVSRLTRSVAFLSKLLEADDVKIRFADMPKIEGAAGKFLVHQMASVAELEAGMISSRRVEAREDRRRISRARIGLGDDRSPSSRPISADAARPLKPPILTPRLFAAASAALVRAAARAVMRVTDKLQS